jgi:uncharacterized protein
VILWTQNDEQGIGIAVGRGAESVFNDAKVSRYARDARPLFNEGKYYEGFNKILDDIEAELHTTTDGKTTDTSTDDYTTWIITIAIIIFIIFIALRIFDNFTEGAILGGAISSIGRGSGGGFSGGSFGGGSFGGGGGRG